MTKKELEKLIKLTLNKIEVIDKALFKNTYGFLTITDAKRRDYIVRTKYLGKLKDKNIIKDFKKAIETGSADTFDSICNKLLNYEFDIIDGDRACDILHFFYQTLQNYEDKQLILDDYGTKA